MERWKSYCRFWLPLLILGASSCSRDPGKQAASGLEALENGKATQALRPLQRASETLGPVVEAAPLWNAMGVAYSRTGAEELAEQAFEQAVELDPLLTASWVNLGILYRGQGRAEEAASSFLRAAESDPLATEALEIQVVDSIRQGDRELAYTLIRQAVSREETARTLSSLAVLSVDLLSVEERRELLQRAVSLEPKFSASQLNLAALLDQHRLDPEQALVHYEAFSRLEPESPLIPQVVQRMQVMEARVGRDEFQQPDPLRMEVEGLLQTAAEMDDPRQALQLCLQAHALASRSSRQDLRERALRAASTLAPDSARAQVGLARFLQEQGREAEALVAFQAAHSLAPTWSPALGGLVETAVLRGQTRIAQEVLDEARATEGQPAAYYLAVADLYLGSLGDEAAANSLYRQLVSDFPESEAAATAATRLE